MFDKLFDLPEEPKCPISLDQLLRRRRSQLAAQAQAEADAKAYAADAAERGKDDPVLRGLTDLRCKLEESVAQLAVPHEEIPPSREAVIRDPVVRLSSEVDLSASHVFRQKLLAMEQRGAKQFTARLKATEWTLARARLENEVLRTGQCLDSIGRALFHLVADGGHLTEAAGNCLRFLFSYGEKVKFYWLPGAGDFISALSGASTDNIYVLLEMLHLAIDYVKAAGTPLAAFDLVGWQGLVVRLCHLGIDEKLGLELAPRVTAAVSVLLSVVPDTAFQQGLDSGVACEVARLGPSHLAHLEAVKLLPLDSTNCKRLRKLAALHALVGSLPSGYSDSDSRGRCLADERRLGDIAAELVGDPEALVRALYVGEKPAGRKPTVDWHRASCVLQLADLVIQQEWDDTHDLLHIAPTFTKWARVVEEMSVKLGRLKPRGNTHLSSSATLTVVWQLRIKWNLQVTGEPPMDEPDPELPAPTGRRSSRRKAKEAEKRKRVDVGRDDAGAKVRRGKPFAL